MASRCRGVGREGTGWKGKRWDGKGREGKGWKGRDEKGDMRSLTINCPHKYEAVFYSRVMNASQGFTDAWEFAEAGSLVRSGNG